MTGDGAVATWLVGKPGWWTSRRRVQGESRDAVALQEAIRQHDERATVTHAGRGWYDVTFVAWSSAESRTERRAFRVARAPDQSRRGVDEGAARGALSTCWGPGWAISEPELYRAGCASPSGRADLVVLPDQGGSVGVEIKTDRDSLTRLPRQVPLYDGAFARRMLACTPRHLDAARQLVPDAWGLVLLDPATHQVQEVARPARPGIETCPPGWLAGELWSHELLALLGRAGLGRHRLRTNADRHDRLFEHHGAAAVRALALQQLAARFGTRVRAWRVVG